MPPRPTLKDVARAARLSEATASRALRNDPRIPPDTRARVRAAAARLNYRPHPLVTTLMAHIRATRPPGYRATLAYLNPSPGRLAGQSGYNVALWHGAQHSALARGYRIEEFSTLETGITGRRLTDILLARGIRGVLIPPLPAPRGHLSLDWSSFAAVALSTSVAQPALHRVVPCHHHNMRTVLRTLRHRGYRRVGLALPPGFESRTDDLWSAFFALYQQSVPAEDRVPVINVLPSQLDRALDWFHEQRPDVIVTQQGTGMYEGLPAHGVRFPEDVGFVCLSGADPGAGIDERPAAIGAAGVDLLAELLQNNEFGLPEYPKTVLIEGRWVERNTLRPLRPALGTRPVERNRKPIRRRQVS